MCLYHPDIDTGLQCFFVNKSEGLAHSHNGLIVRMSPECECDNHIQDGWTPASGRGRAHWEGEIPEADRQKEEEEGIWGGYRMDDG